MWRALCLKMKYTGLEVVFIEINIFIRFTLQRAVQLFELCTEEIAYTSLWMNSYILFFVSVCLTDHRWILYTHPRKPIYLDRLSITCNNFLRLNYIFWHTSTAAKRPSGVPQGQVRAGGPKAGPRGRAGREVRRFLTCYYRRQGGCFW